MPERARPYNNRNERYRKKLLDDPVLIVIPASMMESRIGMLAFLMPATKGGAPTPAPPFVMTGFSKGQIMPIASTPPI